MLDRGDPQPKLRCTFLLEVLAFDCTFSARFQHSPQNQIQLLLWPISGIQLPRTSAKSNSRFSPCHLAGKNRNVFSPRRRKVLLFVIQSMCLNDASYLTCDGSNYEILTCHLSALQLDRFYCG